MDTRMRGTVPQEERIKLGYALIEVLEGMDLDTREKFSVLLVSVGALFVDEKLPIELFDLSVAALKKSILSQQEGPKEEGKPS